MAGVVTTVEDPLQLFTKLPLRPDGQIKALWPVEEEILSKYYHDLKSDSRVAIQLPTGSGKSIISLILLESWRRSGKRVAVLTSSAALADDMANRCKDLGIEGAVITGKRQEEEEALARIQNKRRYTRKIAIGIMNYWAYMLATDIADPDVLVVDDADFFENLLANYYGVTVSRAEDERLWTDLVDDLSQHRIYRAKLETFKLSNTSEEVQLVYFTHGVELARKLRMLVLSGQKNVSEELSFAVERNKDRMETYLTFVSKDSIVFTPLITPGLLHPKLKDVEQIVFMSATIGSKEYIHRSLGSDIELKLLTEKDITSKLETMGKRVIFPLDAISPSPLLEDDTMRALIRIYETFNKALVICSSYRDAYKVSDALTARGHITTLYKKEADSSGFAKAKSGALITASRFIGLDLPDDACRVAIITKMPFVLGPADALIKNVLNETDYVNEKVSHRLVQAFGRCNRSPQDYAAYFVLDNRLANDNQANAEICGFFPRRMRAELDYGQDYAEIGGLDRCLEVAGQLLGNQISDFEEQIAKRMQVVEEPDIGDVSKPYRLEINGWHELVVRQNYLEAAQYFVNCVRFHEKSELHEERTQHQIAWFHYLAAFCFYLAFLNYGNTEYKGRVVEELKRAVDTGKSSWFSGLQLVVNELGSKEKKDEQVVHDIETQDFGERLVRNWNDFSQTNTSKKRNPRMVWEEIRRVLSEGKHNEVCDKLKLVFDLMGFEVWRHYENEQNEPDLELVATTGARYVCIVEVKTKEEKQSSRGESEADPTGKPMVGRVAIDQVAGHKPRYSSKYPNHEVLPLVFTNREDFSSAAREKACNSVRLLRSNEFSSFLKRFYELMERGSRASTSLETFSVISKIPTLSEYKTILAATASPQVTIEDFEGLVRW